MIATLALAAALQADVYTDENGCRWKRRPVAAAKSASGAKKAVKPTGKPRPVKAKPKAPDDEFIGCDEDGYGVWSSDLEDLDFIRTEVFETSEIIKYEAPELELVPPVSFTQVCDCAPGYPVFGGYPIFIGGGGFVPPLTPGGRGVTPVPEPETWLMMLVGLLALLWRRT